MSKTKMQRRSAQKARHEARRKTRRATLNKHGYPSRPVAAPAKMSMEDLARVMGLD